MSMRQSRLFGFHVRRDNLASAMDSARLVVHSQKHGKKV